MSIVQPNEEDNREEYILELVQGIAVHPEPIHARDFFGNFDWHAGKRLGFWQPIFDGEVMHVCNVLVGYEIESACLLGSVKKINSRHLFLFCPRKEQAPWKRRFVRVHLSLKEVGWGPPGE